MSVWKEGTREKEDPLLTAGNLGSHKSKRGTHSHTSTHPYRVTLNTNTHSYHTLFFLSRWVCADAAYMIPFSFFCLSVFLSHLSFILFTWAGSTKGCRGLFLPVIPHCTWVCVSVSFFFFSNLFYAADSFPVFLNLYFHRLRAHWHSPSFFPLLYILRWLAS